MSNKQEFNLDLGNMADEDIIRDRIAGCLLGGALGDSLGYEIEFSDWQNIKQNYGKNGISFDNHKKELHVSDDTQMTLFTAEGMQLGYRRASERGICAPVESYIYESYLCWMITQGYNINSLWEPVSILLKNPDMYHLRAPGNTCLDALNSGIMGSIEKPINESKGCGGVMRTAPLGCMRQKNGKSPWGSPLENGAKAAAITHGHPLGWISAGMLSDIVDRCVYFQNNKPLETIILESLNATVKTYCNGHKYFEEIILRAIGLAHQNKNADREVHVNAIHSLGGGWVGEEALAIAIYAVLCEPPYFDEMLETAVNHSGDSDSTGAIAGNIFGAYYGAERCASFKCTGIKPELYSEIERITDIFMYIYSDCC